MPTIRVSPRDRTDPASRWIAERAGNVFSQTGEDGMIAAIFSKIGIANAWCVEFGAWDGIHLSNTRNLIVNNGWRGVAIEADAERFKDLCNTYPDDTPVYKFNEFVGFGPDNSLDQILERTECPISFDLLSIDIDGLDWHVWAAVQKYRPRVVVIEFNPCIPQEVYFVQDPDPTVSQGNSLLAIVELAKSKGYELVATAPWNAFFVLAELFPLMEIANNSIEALDRPLGHETHFMQAYDGTVYVCGLTMLYWSGIHFRSEDLQILPTFLRRSLDAKAWSAVNGTNR